MKSSWVFIALCALSLGTGNVFAEEVHKQNVAEGLEMASPLKAETDMDMIIKQEEEKATEMEDGKMAAEMPIMEEAQMNDDEEESGVVKKDLPVEEENEKQMEGKDDLKEGAAEVAKQVANEAEILEQPGMRRLARYLQTFHGRQIFRANAAAAAQKSNSVSDEDEDAIAEERAVRRRKRVRRRNTKNKVRRHHRNRQVANRRNTSRRRTNNRSTSKRKNVHRVNRNTNRKNTRIVPVRDYDYDYDYDYPVRRPSSSGVRRKSGTRSSSKRKSSKRKSSKRKNKKNKKSKKKSKKNKKNKNKKQKKRRNQNRQQDSSTGRKGEEAHKEPGMESNDGAQMHAQESQPQQQQ